MYKSHILTQWSSVDGNYPELITMLDSGDSIMDVTGQATTNIPADMNAAEWELWTENYATITAVRGDNRFHILSEWKDDDASVLPQDRNGQPTASEFGQLVSYLARSGNLNASTVREMIGNAGNGRTREHIAGDVAVLLKNRPKAGKNKKMNNAKL